MVVLPTVPLPPKRAARVHRDVRRSDRAIHRKCAAIDHGRTNVGAGPGEDRGAAAVLRKRAGSSDGADKRIAIRPVEDQRSSIGDIADDRTARTTIADLECGPSVDRGAARIGVGAGQRQRAGADLEQRTSSAAGETAVLDHAGKGRREIIAANRQDFRAEKDIAAALDRPGRGAAGREA